MRRKYMDLSKQDFYTTTAMMLDKELPPSSEFCIPQNIAGISFTSAGDVITSKFLQNMGCNATTSVRICTKLCTKLKETKLENVDLAVMQMPR